MRSYTSWQLLLFSLTVSILALFLPYFPRVLVGVFSLVVLPGVVLSSACFKAKGWLENAVFGLLLSLILLSAFGWVTLTLLKGQPFWIFLVLYFVLLGLVDFGLRKGKSGKVDLGYKWEKYDKWFVSLLVLLLVSVAFQNYFIGYEMDQGFISKFTRNDHWYYAASSAEVKNQGLSEYPIYPHLPPEKDRYPVGSFVLFGILSVLLNIPAIYLVQYLGILVPLGLSLAFYHGGQLFFKEKKTAFFAFLFGTVLHLGWSFFFTPTSWYRYQGLPIPWWTVPLFFLVVALAVWLLVKLYLYSRKSFWWALVAGVAFGGVIGTGILKTLSTKLAASITWLIPILYYDWTYDSSFPGMQPLQVFFSAISPKSLSLFYQLAALLIVYLILTKKEKKTQRKWQVLLFLDILLMSFNHPSSFLPFALFLGILVGIGLTYKKFRALWAPIIAGGIVTIAYGVYYVVSVAAGQSYLKMGFNGQYGLLAFLMFYGFHWLFSYHGWKSVKNKMILTLLSLYIASHWIILLVVKNTFNASDLGRVLSATLIPLAFLSAAGVFRFNQKITKEYKLGVWGIITVIGACYFLIYPLNLSQLQPNQYLVPKADLEAYNWIRTNTAPNAIFIVALNQSEYNSHELTVFAERKTLIDSVWNLKLYHYPEQVVEERIKLVNKIYESGLSDESLKELRTYVDEKLGKSIPLYVFVGSHGLQHYPFLATLAVDANKVVFNNKQAVLVEVL
ncbi:MAG TPA: hypothetical protein VJG90_06590 [Candidatus Nanoarchaeia archaeon]|nr:hypothetical protein [Candidatus Nanoarchaeia archaeon]